MLRNDYLMFGNSIMQKYCGMTSRINPLALFFLQDKEEEEPQPISQASVTNVHNYRYNTNYHTYNQIVKRYMYNYNQTLNVINKNSLYANNPNFKLNIHNMQLNHTTVQNVEDLETVMKQTTELLLKEYVHNERIEDKITQKVIKQLTDGITADSLNVLPGKIREKIYSQIIKEIEINLLPVIQKQENSTTITKKVETVIKDSVNAVIEQNTGRLPKPVVTDIATKLTQELSVQLKQNQQILLMHANQQTVNQQIVKEQNRKQKEFITDILINQIEPYIMGTVSGTSRFIIRQEIKKVCEKEEEVERIMEQLQVFRATEVKERDTFLISKSIQSLIQKVIMHADAAKKGKEKYDRQIISRLTPLPVRTMNLEFKKEMKELEEEAHIEKQKQKVIQQKVVQVLRKEQTAENKYYTHFIEKFLKKATVQESMDVDRSSLPAGIIYHKKPKETIHFVNKDIISMPLEMLKDSSVIKDTTAESVTNEGQSVEVKIESIKEIINKEIIDKEVINKETINKEFVKEVSHQMESIKNGMQEYVERKVIHKEVPNFTIHSFPEKKGQMDYYQALGQKGYPQNRTLDLTLLVYEKENAESSSSNSVMLQRESLLQDKGNIKLGEISHYINVQKPTDLLVRQENMPQISMKTGQDEILNRQKMAPVSLVYKQDEVKNKESGNEQISSKQSNEKIEIQQDIEFTKNIVTKQSVNTDIIETINRQTEILETGQVQNNSSVGQRIGQVSDVQKDVRMEEMISESVSKHMDENLNEISKQVYRTIKRRIQKEQERRGL